MIDFCEEYAALEGRFRAQAQADGHTYLPTIEPAGPVRWIFVAMEPSYGSARSLAKAQAHLAAGCLNFLPGGDVAILRWAARRYLCGPDGRYHITDVSKGMVDPKTAPDDREPRWARWTPLLVDEIALIGPDAGIVALGEEVRDHLRRHGIPCAMATHYSSIAGNGRKVFARQREAAFDAFSATLHRQDIMAEAVRVLDESGVSEFARTKTLGEIELTPSRRKLAFRYSVEFEEIARTGRPAALGR